MSEMNGFTVAPAEGQSQMPGVKAGSIPPQVVPLHHGHHWSIYLVFASACLLVAGLASDPKVAEMVRSLLALR